MATFTPQYCPNWRNNPCTPCVFKVCVFTDILCYNFLATENTENREGSQTERRKLSKRSFWKILPLSFTLFQILFLAQCPWSKFTILVHLTVLYRQLVTTQFILHKSSNGVKLMLYKYKTVKEKKNVLTIDGYA